MHTHNAATLTDATLTVFRASVAARAKPGADIIATLTPEKAHLWHMASAAMGEVAELVDALPPMVFDGAWIEFDNDTHRATFIKELGDIEFYLQGIRSTFGIMTLRKNVDASPSFNIVYTSARLMVWTAGLFDIIKKYVIYNGPRPEVDRVKALIELIEIFLFTVREIIGATHEEVLHANNVKLGARYPDGYSDADAQQRKDTHHGTNESGDARRLDSMGESQ